MNNNIELYEENLEMYAKILQSLAIPRLDKCPIETQECTICMDPFGKTNKMILKCGHQFCGDCILHHFQLEGGTACPMCRQEFATRVENWRPPYDSEFDSDSEYDSDLSDDDSSLYDSSDEDGSWVEDDDEEEDEQVLISKIALILKEDAECLPDVELKSDATIEAERETYLDFTW